MLIVESKNPRSEEADEETLLQLIEKRERNIKRCKEKILYYTSQTECEASELSKLKVKLETVQSKENWAKSAANSLLKKRKLESSSTELELSSLESESNSALEETKSEPSRKPQLFIPAMFALVNHETSHQATMFVAKSKPKPVVNHETSHQVGIDVKI